MSVGLLHLDFRLCLSNFRAKNTTKSGAFKNENGALTIPKQLQNNLKKSKIWLFRPQKLTEMSTQNIQNKRSSDQKYRFFGSFPNHGCWKYRQVGLLKLKTMPKHFLHKSKVNLKKTWNGLFWPTEWSKNNTLKPPKWPNFCLKISIVWVSTRSRPFKVKNTAQTLPTQLQKNFEQVQKTTFSTPKLP